MHINKKFGNTQVPKKSHILCFMLLAILMGSNIYTYIKLENQKNLTTEAKENKSEVQVFRDKYPLLDPGRIFLTDENLILNIQELREYMKSIPEREKEWADVTAYLEILSTGPNITVNPDSKFFPASLAKLPLSMVIMKSVEQGKLGLDTKIELTPEDADLIRTPSISRDIGRKYDIKFLLERLLLESDNTAYRMLKRQVTEEEFKSIGVAVGLEELFSQDGKISAKDYTRLLRALYTAGYLNAEHSQLLLKLMQSSDYKGFLKLGIPPEAPFAHKWGTNIAHKVYSDSGIVYIPDRPFMISFMIQCKLDDTDECQKRSDNVMKQVGEKTYNYINQIGKK